MFQAEEFMPDKIELWKKMFKTKEVFDFGDLQFFLVLRIKGIIFFPSSTTIWRKILQDDGKRPIFVYIDLQIFAYYDWRRC